MFAAARDVERWPELLPHYRWVTMRERDGAGGIVEMAAWRPFGIARYPTWWVSRMRVDPDRLEVHYEHIDGITRGMQVVWRVVPSGDQTEVTIVHEWAGPALAADRPAGGKPGHRPGLHSRNCVAHPGGDRAICGAESWMSIDASSSPASG